MYVLSLPCLPINYLCYATNYTNIFLHLHMRQFISIFILLFLINCLYTQKPVAEDNRNSFYLSSNYTEGQSMCQYDTLKCEVHFRDTTYLNPFFRWESKMPNEPWHTEQIDTLRRWQISPLIKGKVYRCVVDDTLTGDGLTFRKKVSDLLSPIVNPFPDITLVAEKTTCLLPNGKINLYTNWDTKNLTFFWTNKSKKQHLTDAEAGIYYVVVSDSKTGCRHTFSDTIVNEFVPPTLFVHTRYAECGLSNGAIDLSVSGNDSPFIYKWNTGAETEDLVDVGVGVYRVTVSNAVGCATTEKIGISNVASPFRIRLNGQDATCDKANGKISCQVEGSGAPFSYVWSTGAKTANIQHCEAGKYFVAVKNQYGCLDTAYISLKKMPPLTVSFEVKEVACYNTATGAVITTLSDASQPYRYFWSNGSEEKNLSQVAAGDYTLVVKNADESCELVADVNIPAPKAWQLATDIQYIKGLYRFVANAKGGTEPYTYLWSNGENINPLETTKTGNYWVQVTDAKGCSLSDSVFLSANTDESLYIPNFITPNGDGNNDDFYIKGENITKIAVVISDNLGNVVYEETYKEIHWDASDCGGADCGAGLYRYRAWLYFANGDVKEQKGCFAVQK